MTIREIVHLSEVICQLQRPNLTTSSVDYTHCLKSIYDAISILFGNG